MNINELKNVVQDCYSDVDITVDGRSALISQWGKNQYTLWVDGYEEKNFSDIDKLLTDEMIKDKTIEFVF